MKGPQVFVRSLHVCVGGLQLYVKGLQPFVKSLHALVGGLQLFVEALHPSAEDFPVFVKPRHHSADGAVQ